MGSWRGGRRPPQLGPYKSGDPKEGGWRPPEPSHLLNFYYGNCIKIVDFLGLQDLGIVEGMLQNIFLIFTNCLVTFVTNNASHEKYTRSR